MSNLNSILQGLMRRYTARVTDVKIILDAMIQEGMIGRYEDIENDHIAFRTLGLPHLGIASLEKIFLHYGYQRRDGYFFEGKRLNAYWYAPPESHFPRIFISELRVGDMDEEVQEIIENYTRHIHTDPIDQINLDNAEAVDIFLHSALWELPTLEDYTHLLSKSEYAAWVIYNRYYLNHYTISVHNLPEPYNDLFTFNAFLESIGIVLNTSGGKVKTSPDGLLRQSSTMAKTLQATFAQGEKMDISGSYVEFAYRGVLPQFAELPSEKLKREHRRDGFEANNADKIFESTYLKQKQ